MNKDKNLIKNTTKPNLLRKFLNFFVNNSETNETQENDIIDKIHDVDNLYKKHKKKEKIDKKDKKDNKNKKDKKDRIYKKDKKNNKKKIHKTNKIDNTHEKDKIHKIDNTYKIIKINNTHKIIKSQNRKNNNLVEKNDNLVENNNLEIYDIIQYKVIKHNLSDTFLNNKLWAHLHCFNIDKFSEYYDEYIDKITKHFSVIVTYSEGSNIPNYDFTFLNIINKGMDIGGKFCCINFINNNKIQFDFILMLHSKSQYLIRKKYFDSIILQLENVVPNLNMDDGIYTINKIHQQCSEFSSNNIIKYNNWGRNSIHMDFIIKKLNLPNYNYVFPEGNIYILHKEVANYMFDNRFNIYNKLNYNNSFDYSWFINYYHVKELSYEQAYKKYKTENLFGNNNATKKGWEGIPDCMFEHVFERIPFGICKLLKKNINIINYKDNYKLNKYILNDNNLYINTALIIACHTSSLLKLKAITNNIKYFKDISYIYIINSNEFKGKIEEEFLNNDFITDHFIINNNLTDKQALIYLDTYPDAKILLKTIDKAKEHYKIFGVNENRQINNSINIFIDYQENTNLICHEKWYNCLINIKDKYNNFILTNDSFLIINSIDNFTNLINDNEMVGLLDSYQTKYHYPDFLRIYNTNGINKWINFFESNKNKCKTFYDMIINFEINSTYIFDKKDCLYKMPVNYLGNIHFDDELNINYIENLNYPIIKLKKIESVSYNICNNIKQKSNTELPNNFDPNMYKILNIDLNNLNIKELGEHYLKYGVNEGRVYKTIDLIDDFNSCVYKNLHPDLSHLSEKDALAHFYKNGVFEGRKYKKNQEIVIPEYLKSKLSCEIKECII